MADISGAANFDISRVISRAFGVIGGNVLLFIGLSLILTGIPTFAMSLWQLDAIQGDPSLIMTFAFWQPLAITWLVAMVTGAVLQAALTRATITQLGGEKPDFARSLRTGLVMIVPLIALALIAGVALLIGFMLLIVPGILLWLAWSVLVPVYIEERTGIFGAFGRSAELTSGARGKIFLLFLAVVVGIWLLNIPVSMFSVPLASQPIALAAVQAITSALTGMVMVTVQASTYVELRDVKEGVAPGELEAIFA